MALASVTYTTSGVGPYPIPFHVPAAQDLVVTLDDVVLVVTTDWTVDTGNLNLTLVASSTGAELVIRRETSPLDADLPVDYTNGAAITKQNLDDSQHHLLHLIQELDDDLDNVTGATGPQGPPGPAGADGAGDEMMIFMGL